MDDRSRLIESLIEEGDALRRLFAVKRDHPSLLEEDLDTLLDQCVKTLDCAIDFARKQSNSFRQVVAGVNMAYAGFYGERLDIIEKGLISAREAIPDNYLITRQRLPNSRDPNIYHPQVFNELARIHMLIGHRLFGYYKRLDQSVGNVKEVAQEYTWIAALFVDHSTADFQKVEDCLHYAIRW